MDEWHVFTLDGEEYIGRAITFESSYQCFVLFHYYRAEVLWETGRWFWKKSHVQHEDKRAYDYIIPFSEIKRIERWDVSTEANDTDSSKKESPEAMEEK